MESNCTGATRDGYTHCIQRPLPADLGFHSPKPVYKGQRRSSNECQYLDGKPCYYDGSGLNAKRVFGILVKKGGEAVWKELEDYYKETFGELI